MVLRSQLMTSFTLLRGGPLTELRFGVRIKTVDSQWFYYFRGKGRECCLCNLEHDFPPQSLSKSPLKSQDWLVDTSQLRTDSEESEQNLKSSRPSTQ